MDQNLLTHDYAPEQWNDNIYIKGSHNCYAYMLNNINTDLATIYKKNHDSDAKEKNRYINPQPGHYCGMTQKVNKTDTTCEIMFKRIMCDNPNIKVFTDIDGILNYDARVHRNEKMGDIQINRETHYLGALTIDNTKNNSMYHFYRQDNNDLWSHKDGGKPATNLDNSNRIISDPKTADRGRYNLFCGYLSIPKNTITPKNMARNNFYNNKLHYSS